MKGIPRGLAVSLPRFVVIAVLLGGLPRRTPGLCLPAQVQASRLAKSREACRIPGT